MSKENNNTRIDLKNGNHIYLSFETVDTNETIISTGSGLLIIPEAEAVKMANEILNNYYGI